MRSWVEISRSAWLQNWDILSQVVAPALPMAVIKANAYGHGLLLCAKLAEEAGVALLGVDSLEEVLSLREQGIKTPILIMGFIPEDQLQALANVENVSMTCYHHGFLSVIARVNPQVGIHLPIETGLSRQGISVDELRDFLDEIATQKLNLMGLYSHLANVEDVADREYTDKQKVELQKAIAIVNEYQFDSVKIHLSASGAAILYSDIRYDVCRLGIAQYGLWPSERIREQAGFELKPVLTWKTCLAQVKRLPAGTPVSYGLTEVVQRDSLIAVLPVGYYDGYDRSGFSSRAFVLVGGKRCKVMGRVCMNMCMVDVSDVPAAKAGDEAVLIGQQGDERISVEELAKLANTLNYEIVTRISAHLPRVLVG